MISSLLIKKWKRMLKNESVFHVNQTEGKYYSKAKLKGYYNDLREKVLYTTTIDENGIPFNIASFAEETKVVYFAISIFQYGLGAYDLYLETKDALYRDKLLIMADWAIKNQFDNGAWDAFGSLGFTCAVSSMAQGEGASLLARAYIETLDEKYKIACIKAVEFMLKEKCKGGTTEYIEEGLVLLEYPEKPVVLNGWIFSAFGLLDCWKITAEEKYFNAWKASVAGIKAYLPRFDAKHWSLYDLGGKYTSPFYHNLHIDLLKAINTLTPEIEFEQYIEKWSKYKKNPFWSKIAFLIKAKQKLTEKRNTEWILTG